MKPPTVDVQYRDRAPWWVRGPALGLWRLRWHLTPYAVWIASTVAGWLAAVAVWAGWSLWVAAAGAAGALVAAAWISQGLEDGHDRALAAVAVVAGGGYAAAVAVWPLQVALYPTGVLVATVLGPAWWWGGMRRLVERDRWRRKVEAGTALGRDGGRLIGFARTVGGWTMRLRLRGRRFSAQDRDQLALDLRLPPGSLFATVDPRDPTEVTVQHLGVDTFAGPEIPHPALAAAATEPGGPWAPGSRSILDPVPIGVARDGTARTLRLFGEEGARHVAVFGRTGSGKSVSLNDIAAHVAACRDAGLWVSDVPKGGATFTPWEPAVARFARTPDDTAAMLDDLLGEIDRRGPIVARSTSDKWQPTPDGPAIVCVIEESAALFGQRDDIADRALDVARLGRSAGVCLVIVSQGTDWGSIPTQLRENLTVIVAHRMSQAALRRVWPEAAGMVDMSLFEVPGLLYLNDGGGLADVEDLVPVRALGLYRPEDRRRLAETYASARPRLAVASGATPRRDDTVDARQTVERAAREAAEQVAVKVAAVPVDELVARVPSQPEPDMVDDEVARRILAALREAGEAGMSSSAIATAVESSPATVLRRLGSLKAVGRVVASGNGPATRWRLAETLAEVAR